MCYDQNLLLFVPPLVAHLSLSGCIYYFLHIEADFDTRKIIKEVQYYVYIIQPNKYIECSLVRRNLKDKTLSFIGHSSFVRLAAQAISFVVSS